MKIAASSAFFAPRLSAGTLTQLEWLDLCANELEADGVVLDASDFPRTDADYVAQLKKMAADLGLSIAGLAAADLFGPEAIDRLAMARALGAPLAIARAAELDEDPAAWGAFADAARTIASAAKRENVTVALRNAPGTLCADPSDLRRLAKDVDSAWLRYGLEPAPSDAGASDILAKTVIAFHTIDNLGTFATPGDTASTRLISALARFRGFVVLESTGASASPTAYHDALSRFATQRAAALAAGA